MSWSGRLLSRVERYAVANLTAYWIACQALAMFLIWAKPEFAEALVLDTNKILQGQWWRAISFLFMPASLSPIFSAFVLYFYWLMGSALEANWGKARYNAFLLLGAVANIGAAFIPVLVGLSGQGSNYYLMESVFLAFATLYPDFTIYLFFILPIRVKWLALVTGIILALQIILADWPGKAMAVISVANYLLFFRREIIQRLKFGRKQMQRQVRRLASSGPDDAYALHRCTVCGATERTHPQLDFRYCAACGNKCYCLEHLPGHSCAAANTPPP
jgi:hypothetical protein